MDWQFSDHALIDCRQDDSTNVEQVCITFLRSCIASPIPLQVTQRKSIIAYTNLQLDKIKINDLRSWEFMLRARTDALALLEAACRQAGSLSTWTMCWWLSFAAQRKMVKNKFILQLNCDHALSLSLKKKEPCLFQWLYDIMNTRHKKDSLAFSKEKERNMIETAKCHLTSWIDLLLPLYSYKCHKQNTTFVSSC